MKGSILSQLRPKLFLAELMGKKANVSRRFKEATKRETIFFFPAHLNVKETSFEVTVSEQLLSNQIQKQFFGGLLVLFVLRSVRRQAD